MRIDIGAIKEKLVKNPDLIKVTIIVLIIIVAFLVTMCGGKEESGISIETQDPKQESFEDQGILEAEQGGTIIVDVGGAVNNPGVIELPEGSRIYQAIEKAGGVTRDGDLDQINQAILLNDCDKLYIPTFQDGEKQTTSSNKHQGVGLISASAANSNSDGRVNINTASQEELETLNGVGPVTANKIIDYRTANGRFDAIENIMEVPGIGEKTFASLKDRLCI